MSVVIQVDRLSKQYRLGQIGGKRFVDDVNRWWARARGKEDPNTKIGTRPKSRNGSQDSRIWALNDVSFEVKQGEVLGIIGRNGAGKSTVLKILSRVTAPTAGEVRVRGRIASLLEVGTGFHPDLTGRENVYLNGAILGMTKDEIRKKFDEIVAFSEVEQFIDTPVKRYSSGMRVRLAFAVAAHLEPEIMIVDEVLAVGDAGFQKKCIGKMKDVAGEGRTVLFVGHNMPALENLCQRVILLENGRMMASGPSAEIISQYLSRTMDLSKVAFAERTDRKGAGEIRVTSIETLDEEHQPAQYVVSGRRVTFRMRYACNTSRIYANCRIWLAVSKENRPYIMMPTDVATRRRLDLQGVGYVDFSIPELPLSAGDYVLEFFVDSSGVAQDELAAARSLSVVDGDFYGSGRDYPVGWAGKYVLVKFGWERGPEKHIVGSAPELKA